MSVQRRDAAALQHGEGVGVVTAGDERREPLGPDFPVQLSKVVFQVMHDTVRAYGVDARDVEERAPPVQPGVVVRRP